MSRIHFSSSGVMESNSYHYHFACICHKRRKMSHLKCVVRKKKWGHSSLWQRPEWRALAILKKRPIVRFKKRYFRHAVETPMGIRHVSYQTGARTPLVRAGLYSKWGAASLIQWATSSRHIFVDDIASAAEHIYGRELVAGEFLDFQKLGRRSGEESQT